MIPEYPDTLWELLAARAESDPDLVLLEDDRDRTLTAGQWIDQAERVAAGLQAFGVKADTVVTWQLPTVIESCVLLMAISRLSAVSNPVIPLLREREVGFIVAQTGAEVLITPERWRNFDYAGMAASISRTTGVKSLVLGEDGLPEGGRRELPNPPDGAGDPVRHIYYTSGSTADPKGALHSDRSAMHGASATIIGWALDAADRITVPFPYTHIGGLCNTVTALHTRARLLLTDIFDADRSPLVMSRQGATLLGSALPFYQAYLKAQKEQPDQPLFPRIKAFNGGGAPKPPELYYELKKVFGVGIVSAWGLTEFPSASCGSVDDDGDDDLAYTEGRVGPGVEIRAVGPDGRDVAPGEEGELWLRGPQCCKGYVDRKLDQDAFDPSGFFRTGDLGVIGPRGHVRITGRSKDVIIRNAENISAQEVENILYEHPGIADVAVVGVPDPRTGERACAVIVPEGGARITLAEIAEFCRSRGLANQKIPERLEMVDALPRNSMGKVLKRDLRAAFGSPAGR